MLGVDTRQIDKLHGRLSILPQDAQYQSNVPILDQLIFFRLLDGRSKAEAQKEVMEKLVMSVAPQLQPLIDALTADMKKEDDKC